MANMSSAVTGATSAETPNTSYRFAMVVMTSIFFAWGFITCLNDILIPHLKGVFSLSYTQAMMIQFCFFGAYFVCSVPVGRIVNRIGYKMGIIAGLCIAALGALLFYPASVYEIYGLFLGALFVLASGITVLQVAANPYVVALGKPEHAPTRLNLTQAFNSLGTTVAPVFGGILIFGALTHQDTVIQADAVQLPYLLIALFLVLLAVAIFVTRLPVIASHESEQTSIPVRELFKQHPALWYGVLGIFFYVGGEVAIGSFLVNFLGEPHVLGLSEGEAASLVAYYWGGAMVGRFIGSAVMLRLAAHKVLGVNACVAALLVIISMFGEGNLAMLAILAVGLFNSIMFPTIFSLALRGLGAATSQGSGLLCLAIVGGALVPLLQGVMADVVGLSLSFVIPVGCYLYIAWYGFKGTQKVAIVASKES